jgi:hypothetical protein
MSKEDIKIDDDLKMWIGAVLGESSVANIFEEMAAIAAVLDKQRKARKADSWSDFVKKNRSFAFAFTDSSPRYALVNKASEDDIKKKEPMLTAFNAVKHVLSGGDDYSNGAYFWDGDDLQSNYKNHPKVKAGIHFSDEAHNIFKVEKKYVHYEKVKVTGKGATKKTEKIAECDWVYESTAAFSGLIKTKKIDKKTGKSVISERVTGTVFWKQNSIYAKYFGSGKEWL